MDKFDLYDMECEYDIVSGTEKAYERPAVKHTLAVEKDCETEYPTYKQDSELQEYKDKAASRKATPVFSGVLMYFPDAIQAVARCSKAGNDQHHPDLPLHWDRDKSQDEKDALVRHLMQSGEVDSDGIRHSAKAAWRALANLQKELESDNEAPLSEYNGYQW